MLQFIPVVVVVVVVLLVVVVAVLVVAVDWRQTTGRISEQGALKKGFRTLCRCIGG